MFKPSSEYTDDLLAQLMQHLLQQLSNWILESMDVQVMLHWGCGANGLLSFTNSKDDNTENERLRSIFFLPSALFFLLPSLLCVNQSLFKAIKLGIWCCFKKSAQVFISNLFKNSGVPVIRFSGATSTLQCHVKFSIVITLIFTTLSYITDWWSGYKQDLTRSAQKNLKRANHLNFLIWKPKWWRTRKGSSQWWPR